MSIDLTDRQTDYETDVAAWAVEQAELLRQQRFDVLDWEHIAEELEDVGKSEQRELASRFAVLIAHLLKWQFQSDRRSKSWERTIKEQRKALAFHLKKVPSLKPKLRDSDWLEAIWSDAVTIAIRETALADFPENCPWTIEEILDQGWFPEA
ncbi:MAG: DUF29 domain-containing protein [Prochlorotrichaceae cyanobacterium]